LRDDLILSKRLLRLINSKILTLFEAHSIHYLSTQERVSGSIRKIVNASIIGIDKRAYRKGHNYLRLVFDLVKGKLVWMEEDRTKETLDHFFKKLGKEGCKEILAIALGYVDSLWGKCQRTLPSS
jgi:transposase